ncbi:MAG: threonylcarbamoyl-AMP synthase [Clostridium sp.]|nr:threonylcarbamoyl-AMP synthase [Clostridium sp.]
METKIVAAKTGRVDESLLEEAGQVLKNGGLVAFPTETVYGLGGDAFNPASARKIYAAKGRPCDNPLIVHICRFEDLYAVAANVTEATRKAAAAFWPGPLTMILPKRARVPLETTGGLDTVAVRLPSHPVARKLIAYGGGYVAAPSANVSGKPSPTSAKHVAQDLEGKIDWILDGGETRIGLESTILDMTISPPQILRPGSVTKEMLETVLGRVEMEPGLLSGEGFRREGFPRGELPEGEVSAEEKAPRSPGMKYRHYAPKGELTIVSGPADKVAAYINARAARGRREGEKVGVIAAEQTLDAYRADAVKAVGNRMDEEEIARNLYRILRELDEEAVTEIYSEAFPAQGLGQAVMNRLLKAAGYREMVIR